MTVQPVMPDMTMQPVPEVAMQPVIPVMEEPEVVPQMKVQTVQ